MFKLKIEKKIENQFEVGSKMDKLIDTRPSLVKGWMMLSTGLNTFLWMVCFLFNTYLMNNSDLSSA